MISIKGLHKFFNKGKQNEIHVINNVTLDLPERGMTAIFGKSGCGKTTLLNVIGGLDGFAEGSITIEGRDIRKNTDDIRNEYVGYIFQNYNLNKSESCFDNVADALRLCGMRDKDEIEKRVMAALRAVDMEKYAKRTPDTLSGGQQQRIAIARAIVKNPRIILADEPTGNLDEANTIMIMDLLRAISKEHLVLLVTHEASLVDYYCDTVIEISDGKIESVRENSRDGGYYSKDKTSIYLGDLEKQEFSHHGVHVEYYGKSSDTPIDIKVVNNGGKLYLQLDGAGVQIIDNSSEIKLVEGVFEEKAASEEREIDMSSLPRVTATRLERLFTFKSSLISGYKTNFKGKKKGQKALRRCMCLFAAVVVIMSAVFGTAIKDFMGVNDAYNHNVFYVYTPDAETSAQLNAAVGNSDSAIDYVRLNGFYPEGDSEVYFSMSLFETFNQYFFEGGFSANAVYLDASLARDAELLAGKKDGLSPEEIILSDKVADELIEKATIGYIEEYEDLIGITSTSFWVRDMNLKVAGVVKTNETSVYLSDIAMAKYVQQWLYEAAAEPASDFDLDVQPGKAVVAVNYSITEAKCPAVNDTITIQGRPLTVERVVREYADYASWLSGNGIEKHSIEDYFTARLIAERPELDTESDEFHAELLLLNDQKYFEYFDYYYDRIDAFLSDCYLIDSEDFELWLYFKKGITDAKYIFCTNEYYAAVKYKEQNGAFPKLSELGDNLPEFDANGYYKRYEAEFDSTYHHSIRDNTVLISDEDYVAISKQFGKTDEWAYNGGGQQIYTVVHSSNPKKTAEWLGREFSHLHNDELETVITPDYVFKTVSADGIEKIVTRLLAMLIILAVMSVCMYFIMRSSLMNRIKEVGIYRAIGVSRKNLIFRFFIEALVLTVLTVVIGFIAVSAYLFASLSLSPISAQIFFYPEWYALIVFVVITSLSLICGILPILSLLRKTPSEILSKYDI